MTTVYSLKPRFQALLRPLANRWAAGGGTANQLTTAGLGAAALAGGAVALATAETRWLLMVPALLFARMALNAIDGMVAREHRQASDRGRVFNEMADVVGDALSYLPFALAFPGHAPLVILIVVLALLTEFAAVLDITRRRNEGPMGKSDRAFLFGLIALLAGAGVPPGRWLDIVLVGALVALVITLGNRLKGTQ